ncbi:jerky protein homolog-like [Frankliniella occidentalis]|uniref:Jerky protein homolog-like n=1 Tax=Frankliniella occidentalis TaxID=133901 RepID=A0A9C6XUR3_FRAOC|nr:jerky protein homolog-like [Frankliniella occidentalis]
MSVDDTKLYCTCRSRYDGEKFMLSCDLCLNWFHGVCTNISEDEVPNTWFCDNCTALNNMRKLLLKDMQELLVQKDQTQLQKIDQVFALFCLYWKAFPARTLAAGEEKGASGFKANKERVTVLCCANATGSHQLPLLMIGKPQVPRCWRGRNGDLSTLPVIYTNQSKAWMDAFIFLDWFGSVFVPHVQARQARDGITGQVRLLVDNASCHPPGVLDDIADGFKVIFLPPNCTSLLQPMDQGAIEVMKRAYRRHLLRRLLCVENFTPTTVKDFQKALTLDDCATLVAQAWASVGHTTLARVWRKLLGKDHDVEPGVPDTPPPSPADSFLEDLRRVNAGATGADVHEWVTMDKDEFGHKVLSDDDIVNAIRDEWESEDEEEVVGQDHGEDVAAEVVEEVVMTEPCPSREDAENSMKVALEWFKHKNPENTSQIRELLSSELNSLRNT